MAQDRNADFPDVENIIIRPSPNRVRNILTLEERVRAIKAFDRLPMYTKVARMFNCSWEQIKNIIANRTDIMEFYEATTKRNQDDRQSDGRQKKLKFLGECVYEYIQRAQYHAKVPVTEELIRTKALEFQDFIHIDEFHPNKYWMNIFKATYNISIANKHITLSRIPPASLDLKEITAYVTRMRSISASTNIGHLKELRQKYTKFDANNEEYELKRLRKMKFLEKTLYEYLERSKFHHKSLKLNINSLCLVAKDLNDILRVQDFEPNLTWINDFWRRYKIEERQQTTKKIPALSLDLKDIISYCSRLDNKTKATTITLKQKDQPASSPIILPTNQVIVRKIPIPKVQEQPLKFQNKSIIYLEDVPEEDKDIKPDIEELKIAQQRLEQVPPLKIRKIESAPQRLEQPPPLKIRKIESINNDPNLQIKLLNRNTALSVAPVAQQIVAPPKIQQAEEPIVLKKEIINEEDEAQQHQQQHNTKEKPIQKAIEQTSAAPDATTSKSRSNGNAVTPPIVNSTDSSKDTNFTIRDYKDVLRFLKPLEEYAMLKENYRAIGLITQLEKVLKAPPTSSMYEEEES